MAEHILTYLMCTSVCYMTQELVRVLCFDNKMIHIGFQISPYLFHRQLEKWGIFTMTMYKSSRLSCL